jgi:hypothetical protein
MSKLKSVAFLIPAKAGTVKTIAQLCDEFGDVYTKHKPLHKRLESLKEEIKDRIGAHNSGKGAQFEVQVAQTPTETLDIEAIRRDMPAKWLKKYTKNGTKTTCTPTRIV